MDANEAQRYLDKILGEGYYEFADESARESMSREEFVTTREQIRENDWYAMYSQPGYMRVSLFCGDPISPGVVTLDDLGLQGPSYAAADVYEASQAWWRDCAREAADTTWIYSQGQELGRCPEHEDGEHDWTETSEHAGDGVEIVRHYRCQCGAQKTTRSRVIDPCYMIELPFDVTTTAA